jgi:hypothetical protein
MTQTATPVRFWSNAHPGAEHMWRPLQWHRHEPRGRCSYDGVLPQIRTRQPLSTPAGAAPTHPSTGAPGGRHWAASWELVIASLFLQSLSELCTKCRACSRSWCARFSRARAKRHRQLFSLRLEAAEVRDAGGGRATERVYKSERGRE